jgi:HEPN domain-containing protein
VTKRADPRAWLDQAENDCAFAKAGAREGFYSQVCVLCQQAAEKALKSIILAKKRGIVFTHSLTELCRLLRINGRLLHAANVLDLYYTAGRYPDVLPGGAPFRNFSQSQAQEALRFAAMFIKRARSALKKA